jgi:hypothetical protein
MSLMNHQQFNPAHRGLHAIYRPGETNYCPGCGRTHWHIGRLSAECAFCSTAMPYSGETLIEPKPPIVTRGSGGPKPDFRGDYMSRAA